MIEDVLHRILLDSKVTTHYGVSETTVRKWLARFLDEGREGLSDRSSRPARFPQALAADNAENVD